MGKTGGRTTDLDLAELFLEKCKAGIGKEKWYEHINHRHRQQEGRCWKDNDLCQSRHRTGAGRQKGAAD